MKIPYHRAARGTPPQRATTPSTLSLQITGPGKSRKGKEEGEAVSVSAAGAEGGYLLANRGLNSAPSPSGVRQVASSRTEGRESAMEAGEVMVVTFTAIIPGMRHHAKVLTRVTSHERPAQQQC
jgi:hypothetical protein